MEKFLAIYVLDVRLVVLLVSVQMPMIAHSVKQILMNIILK